MYCPDCGEEIDDGSAFCRYCGSSLSTDTKDKDDSGESSETAPSEPTEGTDTDSDADHPIVETWLGLILLWGSFVSPAILALVFAATGIGSFPPVRRWVASTVGDVPRFLEVVVAVVYLLAIPTAIGSLWWYSYQATPLVGRATIVTILMIGILGVFAAIPVILVKWFRS